MTDLDCIVLMPRCYAIRDGNQSVVFHNKLFKGIYCRDKVSLWLAFFITYPPDRGAFDL